MLVSGLRLQLEEAHREIERLNNCCAELEVRHSEEVERLLAEKEEQVNSLREEIYSAWNFSMNEKDAEIHDLKEKLERNRVITLQATRDALEGFPHLEAERRRAIEQEEAAANPATRNYTLREKYLRRRIISGDTFNVGKGLHDLWKEIGTYNEKLTQTEIWVLLSSETHINSIFFNVIDSKHRLDTGISIPLEDFNAFIPEVVCKLPALKGLNIWCLPSLSEYVLPWVETIPRTVKVLSVPYSSFTVDDLVSLSERSPHLETIHISLNKCASWGSLESVDPELRLEKLIDMCPCSLEW